MLLVVFASVFSTFNASLFSFLSKLSVACLFFAILLSLSLLVCTPFRDGFVPVFASFISLLPLFSLCCLLLFCFFPLRFFFRLLRHLHPFVLFGLLLLILPLSFLNIFRIFYPSRCFHFFYPFHLFRIVSPFVTFVTFANFISYTLLLSSL